MNITERREAVRFLVTHRVSVQRACVLVQLQRATFRYQPRPLADDGVAGELSALAQEQPRYGYRRITQRVPGTAAAETRYQSKARASLVETRSLIGTATKTPAAARERPMLLAAAYPSHVWAYDFVEDRDVHDNVLRILTVMDEFTRQGLAIDVDLITSAERVMTVLTQLVAIHGTPDYLRSDNGSELVALAVQAWVAQRQITALYIDPGRPWQNGKDERVGGTLRDECLNMHLFVSVREARVRLEAFCRHYNEERPHSRLGYQTPSEFKQAWYKSQANEPDSHIPT
jgi:putative transposase